MARAERPRSGATKGDRTRAFIVEQAAEAYNVHGYAGLSISDVLARTSLEKGGLYNHFKSKDDLALAAFDHLAAKVRAHMTTAMDAAGPSAAGRLQAMATVYYDIADRPLLRGGCPILNTATEADDTHPALRERARAAMGRWQDLVRTTGGGGSRDGRVRLARLARRLRDGRRRRHSKAAC